MTQAIRQSDVHQQLALLRQALEREQAKLQALQDIGLALGSTLDFDQLVELLLARVTRIMDAERAALYVLDEESGELWFRAAHGPCANEVRLKVGQGLAGWVLETGRSVNVRDAYQDVRFDGEWDRKCGFRTRSTLCVPVKNHDVQTIGVLQVLNKRSGVFTTEDEGMLSALAAQAAISLENSKLFLSVLGKNEELLETKEQLEQKVRELDVLVEIAQVSASAKRLDDLLEGVLARTMSALGAEAGSILFADEETGELRFRCAMGDGADGVQRVSVAANEGICGWVARHGTPQVVADVSADPRHSSNIAAQVGYHPRSVLCVPLPLEGRTGALELLNKNRGRSQFTNDDLKLASVVASHVAGAIKLAEIREQRAQEERLSTIGQLLSGVVHDLRGPMTVIRGYTKLLQTELDATARAQYSDSILRQLETVNAMTGEVLAFARGDSTVLVRKVYLAPFFQELVEHLQPRMDGRSIELRLRLEDRGTAYFDEHKVRRALHNLVRNGIQALGHTPGYIELHVHRTSDDVLCISCEDNGPGVPEEIREHLFESFTSHGKPDGTGLGLAIVRKVAEDHGGRVDMHSEPGHTVFTLTLPQGRQESSLHTPTA